jgi:hypothetical protein
MVRVMSSPPLTKEMLVAIFPSTLMYSFFIAFLMAEEVEARRNIPTQ